MPEYYPLLAWLSILKEPYEDEPREEETSYPGLVAGVLYDGDGSLHDHGL